MRVPKGTIFKVLILKNEKVGESKLQEWKWRPWSCPHNCFGPPLVFLEGLLSTGPTLSSFYLLVEMGLPLHLFLEYILWELDQLFIKRHHHTDLKWTKLYLGPIQIRLAAIFFDFVIFVLYQNLMYEFFSKYKIYIGGMLNSTVFEWVEQNSHSMS